MTTISLSSSLTTIGRSAFENCVGFTSIELPNTLTKIGSSAFEGCKGLTSVAIPNSVTTIESGAFWKCTGLTSVIIPNSVTSIGSIAFCNCSSLTSITSYITDVFETGNQAFDKIDNATLYVPAGLKSTYQSTADWKRLTKIEEMPGISLAMACSDQGKVSINEYSTFTNKLGEVSVRDGIENKFVFIPEEGSQLDRVLINGLDVTKNVKDNVLKTTIYPNYSMMVIFATKGADVNRDGAVDISDVVALVNIILGQ